MTPEKEQSLKKILQAVAEGYPYKVKDGMIVVENPQFSEEWGRDPNLVFVL
jgi:hypothetical protein